MKLLVLYTSMRERTSNRESRDVNRREGKKIQLVSDMMGG